MHTLRLTVIPLLVTLCGCAATLPPNLRSDVAGGNADWIEGLKTGNAPLIARAYAQDAVFCGATGECIKGVEAVTALYEASLRRAGRAVDATVRSDALRVDGDLAYESGRAGVRTASGRSVSGRYSTVWKRQPDGHWKIFRNLSF